MNDSVARMIIKDLQIDLDCFDLVGVNLRILDIIHDSHTYRFQKAQFLKVGDENLGCSHGPHRM